MYHDCMFLSIDVLTGGAVFSIFVIFPIYSPRSTVVFSMFHLNLSIFTGSVSQAPNSRPVLPTIPFEIQVPFFRFPSFLRRLGVLTAFLFGHSGLHY